MKKIIVPLVIAGVLLAGNLFAQKINAKITDSVNITCMGDSNGSAAVEGIGGYTPYTYLWEPGGQTTDTATGLAAGTYTATVIDTASDTAEAIATIGTAAPPIVVATSSSEPSCFGMNNAMAAITSITGGTPPFQIEWLPIMNNNDTVTGLPASTYTAQVTDANGCQVQTPVPVSQPPPLQLTAAAIGTLAAAYANGGTAPYTFSWSPGGQTTDTVSGLHPGTYTVSITDANLCSNVAIVTIPDVYIAFDMPYATESCGNPSYIYFPIMVSTDTTVRFNNCVVDIDLGDGQYLGDSASNGGVTVTPGSQFLYTPGSNDYNILNVTNLSDSVIQIQFGSPTDSSPNGTIIPNYHFTPTFDTLFTVRLRNQNSCLQSLVNFIYDSATAFESYYAGEDSTSYTGNDTIITIVCTDCIHDSCDYDSICGCYLSLCSFDSVTSRIVDTTLYRFSYKNIQYATSSYVWSRYNKFDCPTFIDSFNTPINAGTNAKSIPPNSSILNIKGWGFGSQKGTVMVSNSDTGFDGKGHEDMIALDTMDILSWSENLIKIKMPSILLYRKGRPGSGPFTVISACGQVAPSPQPLQINYCIQNEAVLTRHTTKKYRPDIVMAKILQTDTTSFYWRCDTSVSHNPKALACVKKALQEWNCWTGVNWKLGDSITGDSTVQDNISVIYFRPQSYFPNGATVATWSWYLYDTCADYHDSVIFMDEADMAINSGRNWSYDMTGIPYSRDSVYFYDNMLHEMGHALGLGHINDTLSLMYWQTAQNFRPFITSQGPYYPGPATLLGAMDMMYTSVLPANAPVNLGCSLFTQLDTDSRFCFDPTLSVPVIPQNAYDLNLFPNPINYGDLTITYQLAQNADIQFKISDCTGRVIMKLNSEHKTSGDYSQKINISNLAGGVYLFTAIIDGECQTIKFIKI